MGSQRETDSGALTSAGQGEIKQQGALVSDGIGQHQALTGTSLQAGQRRERGAPMRAILDERHGAQCGTSRERCMWNLSEGQDHVRIAIEAGSGYRSPNRMRPLEQQRVLIADTQWAPFRSSGGLPDQ